MSMAETQPGFGGVGQRESGAYPHTLVIWNWVDEHPGVTRDELKMRALELDWIPRGYAHRYYAAHLKRRSRRVTSKAPASNTVAEVARNHSDAAVRTVITRTLQNMVEWGSLRRDGDGYYALRRPKVTGQVEARVRPRDEVVAGVALAEARRKLLAFGIDRLEEPHAKVPLEVRRSLAKWLRAGQLVEVPKEEW